MTRSWLLLSPFLVALLAPRDRPDPQPARCIVVRDASSGRALPGARVRVLGGSTAVWSDGSGRACVGDGIVASDARLVIDAVGYRSVVPTDAPATVPIVALRRVSMPELQSDSGLRRDQLELALSQLGERLAGCESLVLPSCAQALLTDTTRRTVVVGDSAVTQRARQQLARSTLPLLSELRSLFDASTTIPQLLPDSEGAVLTAYVDTPDSATRFGEVRLALRAGGRSAIGITETRCPSSGCQKSRQVALLWGVDADSVVAPEFAVIDDGQSNGATIFDVSTIVRPRLRQEESSGTPTLPSAVLVSGRVQDEEGRPLPNVEIVATAGPGTVRTDSAGRFALSVSTRSEVLLTARSLGFAPSYRAIVPGRDSVVQWSPRLRSVRQLAVRTVRASGLPIELRSWTYDDVLARRAKGIGKFLVGEEIWSTTGMADALNRIPGLDVTAGPGGMIARIRALRCNSARLIADGLVGLFVNGYERTSLSATTNSGGMERPMRETMTIEEMLSDVSPREVVAIEVYRGRSEIPGEFANPRYCAVISVWTR